MEDEYESAPTSPELPTNTGIVTSAKGFSDALTLDLTDDEIARAGRVLMAIRQKHMRIFRRKFNDPGTFTLDQALEAVGEFEDEIKTEMADKCGILCTVNTVPLLEGKPLEIEWIGKIGEVTEFDHDKKEWEVKHANARGEDFYGQKG